jgi:hypothetical protein
VPPVRLRVLADLRETLEAARRLELASDSPWAQGSMGLEGYSRWALRTRRVVESLAKFAYGRTPRTRPSHGAGSRHGAGERLDVADHGGLAPGAPNTTQST